MLPSHHGHFPTRPSRRGLLALLFAAALAPSLAAQAPQDQAATLLLNSARRAYNEKNHAFATARFREFLQKYGGHKEANSARYGLALCLIEGPEHNYTEALQLLPPAAGDKNNPDHPFALYYTGHAQRALGLGELAQAVARPAEAPQRRATAAQRFEEAQKQFAAAIKAFTDRAGKVDPAKDIPADLEWAARARCDQAEMLTRLLKPKDALAVVAPFLDDRLLVKSRYRRLALYHHGFGSFLLKDYLAAGKSLNQLTPFADPVFGTHARYLLARVLHADGERAEAAAHYEGVLTQHAKQVQDAKEALKNPQAFQNDPDEKARLTAANAPPPDHVARATLYLGVLQYEGGKFAEALTRFTDFEKQFPTSLLLPEVQLRVGFCQVQLKQYDQAIKILQPLVDKQPTLADQALLWLGKAQAGNAAPENAPVWLQAQKTAIDTLRRAVDRANAADPETRIRRGQILLELVDVQQGAKLFKDAANTCNQVLNEKLIVDREQEVLQRLATALHLNAEYTESDKVCDRFRQAHPKSPLLSAILFRYAENAAFAALAVENNPSAPNRVPELARLCDEAVKRYQVLVDKFPESPHIHLARYGLAMGHYRKGDVEKAHDLLEKIPAADRSGDLAAVPYVLADCCIRLAPAEAPDAVAAGKLTEQMNQAIELLTTFVSTQEKAAEAPDALLKLGFCFQRLVEVTAQPPEKAKVLASARTAYEQLMQKYPNAPQKAVATFERAGCLAQAGDVNGAIDALRRFADAPLKDAPVAPMAILRLATLLRGQNRAAEAATFLTNCRQVHDANLLKDPARAGWVPLLQYHQGVALKEAGKLPDARLAFDGVVRTYPNAPEAFEAALRNGQCLKDEGRQKIEEARKLLAQPGRKPEQQNQDRTVMAQGFQLLGESVRYLEAQAEQIRQKKADSPLRARMLYDAAWAARALADQEIETARDRVLQERWQKLKEEVAKKTPQGQPPPFVPPPVVPLSAVPLQESEKKVRSLYQLLITAFPDLETNADARFELAELLSERNEHDAAVKLLKEALDREPKEELTERIKLRLGICLAAKGDTKEALAQLDPLVKNEKSLLRAQATYRAGECHLQAKNYTEASKELAKFRDLGPFQNIVGLSDRALLRLGHALGQLKQWDASRQAHERVVGSFPQSPWVNEARYGIGWAHQQKGEYDQAVNAYNLVTAAVVTEMGAPAQLNIGLCRLAQKRYAEASTALLVVPFTYDYPELTAVALLEAARALAEDKQRDKAVQLLQRLLRDHPDGDPAEAARKRLEELRKS